MRFVRIGMWAALVGGLSGLSAAGQDDQSTVDFGKGVHAYYEGRFQDADSFFTQAIGKGTIDPRPYYFRGLTRVHLGQTDLAADDLRIGAEAEASPRGRAFDIGTSLERVQGPARIKLEQIRREVVTRARPKLLRESDGLADFDAQPRAAVAGGKTPPANAAAGGGLDPRNLPDVASLVDPTVPFPSTDATIPPPNIVEPGAEPAVDEESLPPAAPMPADKSNPTDDPFSDGGSKPDDPPAQDPNAETNDTGGEPAESGDGAAEPPPADKPAEKSDDDPFGG